jgi:hypothetical protein
MSPLWQADDDVGKVDGRTSMDISFYEFSERLKRADREGKLKEICRRSGVTLSMKFSPVQLFPPNTGQQALHKFFAELGYQVPPGEEIALAIGTDVAADC